MGKRKATAVNVPASPAKKSNGLIGKADKRFASSDSEADYDEEDIIEEQIEAEDTVVEMGQCTYDPDEMRVMMESFVEYMKDKKELSLSHLEKLFVDWVATLPESSIDVSVLVTDFKKYLKSATRIKNFLVQDASTALLRYLSSEKSLSSFKSFPVKPPIRVNIYAKKKNISCRVSTLKDVYEQMRDESADVITEVDEEIKALTTQYAAALEDFLKTHPNLTTAQKDSLNSTVKRARKTLKVAAPKTPRKPAGGNKKEPESAFSLFCRSKADKYTDLSEEAREKKLRKKFDKLSDAERDLLEGLALNS